jgi:hypothetical protein
MSEITVETFERAVTQYFEPIAREHNWPLIRGTAELYEIPSPHFVMRIRYSVGAHAKSIYATLIPANEMPGNIEQGGRGELGVAVIAKYNGVPIEYIPWDNIEEGMFGEAKYVADMATEFAIPYMLGQKSDWDEVKAYIARDTEKALEKIKSYKFPAFVQKRWHLPPPPKERGDK